MSFRYGFFNSKNGDRKYFASDFSMIFNGLIEDGVFGNVPDGFPVTSTGGMNIAVGKGLAWFSGTWNYIDAPYPLTVASADVLYARIDAVVIEVHNDNTVRTNYVKMVKGTPSAEPVPPSMEVEGYTLHPLAYVTVPAGAESISSENIRSVVGTSECPFVVGIQKTASVDQLYTQWQAEFDKWFQDLKDNLDENVAANLQNQITTHVTDKTMHIPTLGYSKEGTVHQLTGLLGVSGLASCIFTATDDYMDGDTITIDGEQYAVQLSNGDAAGDRLFVSGVTVSVVVDKENKRVNFKAGGGYVKGDVIAAENLKITTAKYKSTNDFSFGLSKNISVTHQYRYKNWFTLMRDNIPYMCAYRSDASTLNLYNFEGELVQSFGYIGIRDYPDVVFVDMDWYAFGAYNSKTYGARDIKMYYYDESKQSWIPGALLKGGSRNTYTTSYNSLSYSNTVFVGSDYTYDSNSGSYTDGHVYAYTNRKTILDEYISKMYSRIDIMASSNYFLVSYKTSSGSDRQIQVFSAENGSVLVTYNLEKAAFHNYEGHSSYTFISTPDGKCLVALSKGGSNPEAEGYDYNKAIVEFDPLNNKVLRYLTKGCGYAAGSYYFNVYGSDSLWCISNLKIDGTTKRCLVEVDDSYNLLHYMIIPTSGDFNLEFSTNMDYGSTDKRITRPILVEDGRMMYARDTQEAISSGSVYTSKAAFEYVGEASYIVLEVSK